MKAKEPAISYKTEKKVYAYQDWLKLPEDSSGLEIINGELVMSPSPTTRHQKIVVQLSFLMSLFLEQKNSGTMFVAPMDVVLDNNQIVQPDLLYIRPERTSIITEKNIQGAPDLIVEIISPSTAYRDMFDKKDIYEKFAVREYWIIDPMRYWLELFALKDGRYETIQRLEKSCRVQSVVLRGLGLKIEKLFKKNLGNDAHQKR